MEDVFYKISEQNDLIAPYRPFEGGLLDQVKSFYRTGFIWASNYIEGYSYSESETKILLEDGLTAGGKSLVDLYAVIGLAEAYEYMFNLLNDKTFTKDNLLFFHNLLTNSLQNNAKGGVFRNHPVMVSGSNFSFPDFKKVPLLIDNLFEKLESNLPNMHPIKVGAILHSDLVAVHPFSDGNGRTARLAMNTIFIQHGYLPTIIPPILKLEYNQTLDKAHYGNIDPFIEFIAQQVYNTQNDFLRLLKNSEPTSFDTHTETKSGPN
jgi:Fic family protein